MSNILEALVNIVNNKNYKIEEYKSGNNRVQNMGEALEKYVLDAFSNSFDINDNNLKKSEHKKHFSFLGAKNKIPDAILENGEGIEVKKVESESSVQLNSSYPKHTLKSTDSRIKIEAINCENELWDEKEMLYCFGKAPNKTERVESIWFVYGRVFCDSHETYEDIINNIKENLDDDYPGNELGGSKQVDTLKITTLRVRGMWVIDHPQRVFSHLTSNWGKNNFEVKAIIPKNLYNDLPETSKNKIQNSELVLREIKTDDPTNRANEIDCLFIYYKD